MASRFDSIQPNNYQYMSQFVPMPLDNITRLAEAHGAKANKGLDDINKVKSALSIKADPNQEKLASNIQKEYTGKLDELATRLAKVGKYTPEDQQQLSELTSQITNDDRIRVLSKSYDNYYNKYLPDRIAAEKKGEYLPKEHPSQELYPRKDNESIEEFEYTGQSQILDHAKEAQDIFGKITPSGYNKTKTITNADGSKSTVQTGNQYVTKQDVLDRSDLLAKNYTKYPAIKQYVDFELEKNPNLDPVKVAAKYFYDINEYQVHKNPTNIEVSKEATPVREKVNAFARGLGMTVPGRTVTDLTTAMPKELNGIVNYDDNGDVKINYTGKTDVITKFIINRDGKYDIYNSYEDAVLGNNGSPEGIIFKNEYQPRAMNMTEHQALAGYVQDAAKAIQYKPNHTGSIKESDFTDILKQYHNGMKTISYDSPLDPIEANVIKNNMLSDRTNYEYYDESGNPIPVPALDDKSFSPDTRTYKDGKAYIHFTEKKDGKVITQGIAKPLAIEKDNHFNTIAQFQDQLLNFYKSGTISDPNVQDLQKKLIDNKIKVSDMLGGDPKYKNYQVVGLVSSPSGNSQYYAFADPNGDRKNIMYQERGKRYNPKTGKYEDYAHFVNNMPQTMKLITDDWYSTPEGISELTILLNDNEQAKSK